jgi:hypothetical protein
MDLKDDMAWLSPEGKYWIKVADASRRSLLPLVGVLLVSMNGPGIRELSQRQDAILASTSITCHSETTVQKTQGRYPSLYFTDATGTQFGFCSKSDCSYQGWGSDVGKFARICFSGDSLVSVEVEGMARLTREGLLEKMNSLIWWRTLAIAVGMISLGIFAFNEREQLKALVRALGGR